MTKKFITTIALAFACAIIPFKGYTQFYAPQYYIRSLNEIEKRHPRITYVMLQGMDAPEAQPYLDALKENWTLDWFEIVDYREFRKKDTINNYLLTIKSVFYNGNFTAISLDLSLNQVSLASIWLDPKDAVLKDCSVLYKSTHCNFDGYIYNWGPGFFKNYIQFMVSHIKNKQEVEGAKDFADKHRLPELKTRILYIPDYYNSFVNRAGDDPQVRDVDQIMSGYKYSYKVVSTTQLDRMITDSTDGIFYMMPRRYGCKAMRIVDSKSGNVIYAVQKLMSMTLKEKDMEELSKLIAKQ